MLIRLALAIIWLLSKLPLRMLASIGKAFGAFLYALPTERRRVCLTNLELCFPALSTLERETLGRRHFQAYARALLERGILWWGTRDRIRKIVRLEGLEHAEAVRDGPLIVLAPHFVGMDTGWTRLSMELDMISMYGKQKNAVLDAAVLAARHRFGNHIGLTRQDGVRKAVREIKAGRPFYYLPDMDFGPRDTIFVPFFGVPAATITGVSRLARLTGARVLPCVTQMLPGGKGYVVRCLPAWENYPGASVEADTLRMNAFIEEQVRGMPEQYYWVHKRFKTRPPGEKSFYA